MANWSFSDSPDQRGRTALVTGANTGLGFETARMLAAKGTQVILACRNADKGEAAIKRILQQHPQSSLHLEQLDLSDLSSVTACAERLLHRGTKLDLLINNAGVMVPPLSRTKQGFELQFGTNHLGHFALTARLLPLLVATLGARVVAVSSIAHRFGRIDFDDLNWERRRYSRWSAYGQSKLANLLFAMELQRRLSKAGSKLQALASHPGVSFTELHRNDGLSKMWSSFFGMNAVAGALPILRAATDPAAPGGSYWGPDGCGEMRGAPAPAQIARHAKSEEVARKLWEVSERLTGVSYKF